MQSITISKKELKDTVKESIREALVEQMMELRAMLLPLVSEKEQNDIEERHGKPFRRIVKSKK